MLHDRVEMSTGLQCTKHSAKCNNQNLLLVCLSPSSEHDHLYILSSLFACLSQEDLNRSHWSYHYHLQQLQAIHTLPLLCIDRWSDQIHTLSLSHLHTTNHEQGPRVILQT